MPAFMPVSFAANDTPDEALRRQVADMARHPVLIPAQGVAHDAPADEAPARLALSSQSTAPGAVTPGHGPLDGAWWPRSRDLYRELPPLIMALQSEWGHVSRVAVNPTYWPIIPKKIEVSPGRLVHIGWFGPEQDPNKLLLLSSRVGRWDLLVVPPETSQHTARRLMTAACDAHNVATAGELMAQVGTAGGALAA